MIITDSSFSLFNDSLSKEEANERPDNSGALLGKRVCKESGKRSAKRQKVDNLSNKKVVDISIEDVEIESFECGLTRRESMDNESNQTISNSSSRKNSSDELERVSFLNKRDLKTLSKLSEKSEIQSPDMSMIFTPLVKNPSTKTTTASTKSNSSSCHDEPQ